MVSTKRILDGYFLVAGLVVLVFFPFYQRYKYKKHYTRFALENYNTFAGKTTEVTIENDAITTKDFSGEAKFYLTELAEINETHHHIFIKMNSGQSLVIAKKQISSLSDLTNFLKQIAIDRKVNYHMELDWKWK